MLRRLLDSAPITGTILPANGDLVIDDVPLFGMVWTTDLPTG